MTLKGAVLVGLGLVVVLGTAWTRWRLTHGPLRAPAPEPPEER